MSAMVSKTLAIALAGMLAARASQSDSTLIGFRLHDQSNKVHSTDEYLKKVVVVMGSDRAGSKFNEEWGKALGSALRKHPHFYNLVFLGVADIRGVPRIFKFMIKHNFPKDRTVLMDWEGVFAQAYRFKPKATNILVFSPGGKLVRVDNCRGLDRTTLAGIESQVNAILDGP